MGGGRPKSGSVEALKHSIRIKFTYAGERRAETLDLEPTPPNLKYANRLLADINDKIRLGVFNYAKVFPNSKHVQAPVKAKSGRVNTKITFEELSAIWLKTQPLQHSTRSTYQPALNFWNSRFGDRPIDTITVIQIREALTDKSKKVKAKTVNNMLIPLRGIYKLAMADSLVKRDPTVSLENYKHQKPIPDPFSRDEMERILGWLQQHAPVHVLHFFSFAFLTGLRPSEQVALLREDLDEVSRTVKVSKAMVYDQLKPTKTHTARVVDLSGRAMRSALAGGGPYLFTHPETGEPWTRKQLAERVDAYWYPALDALGLHRRSSYNTRHTYATINLMAGVNPAYIARQLGHKNMKMLLETYSRWIDQADKGRERAKVEAAFE